MPKKDKFDSVDLPVEVVDGMDGFIEKGRYLLFIDMLGVTAKDMCQPKGHEDRVSAEEWLNDEDNMKAFVAMIEGDVNLARQISKAVIERPLEVSKACESLVRSSGRNADREAFVRLKSFFMCPDERAESSLFAFQRDESAESLTPAA